ncbi:hypothetical protein HPSA20_0161 [Helicobacter pylori SouthAfrica20]|uniref:Uncharacterized protein n=1 Tax=Helicobacter pylori SouthAfrica20 TaxID=1352356 RepID=T1U853_HELPX|nr:hypothetical protein HPSA20_0161 [Helicobacter pylori SouthAfrica20]
MVFGKNETLFEWGMLKNKVHLSHSLECLVARVFQTPKGELIKRGIFNMTLTPK